jgi:hypothetical protein
MLITGVEAGARNGANLYPNPAVHSVSISVNGLTARSAYLQIRNTGGILVASEEIVFEASGEAQFNIGSLPPGMYFVQVNTGGESRVMKLVKK